MPGEIAGMKGPSALPVKERKALTEVQAFACTSEGPHNMSMRLKQSLNIAGAAPPSLELCTWRVTTVAEAIETICHLGIEQVVFGSRRIGDLEKDMTNPQFGATKFNFQTGFFA